MALSVTDLLIGKLATILEYEGTTIAGVRHEVDKIKEEFLSMKAFLVDAEANKPKTEGQKLWVARIRDLAYDVEDIIDEFMYHMYEKQTGGRLSRRLHKTIRTPCNLWFRHKIAKKLRKITDMIKAISERNKRYGVGLVGGATTSEDILKLVQSQAESSFFIMEDELVGIEGKKQILMGWLMDDEQHQTVISVVGMGGAGKTTRGIKDIIDEFMYHMYAKQTGGRLSRGLHKTIRAPCNLWFSHKIAKKLQKITDVIKAIPERNQRYGVGLVGGGGGATTSDDIQKLVQNQAESSFFIMEDELVGIEGKKQILMGWLMDDEQHQTVISVVGMGGSGKTTLVAKTFTNELVKRHFDCYAWITVSQTYDAVHLFRSLIRELYKSRKENFPTILNAMSRIELLELLVNYLESRKYLVVLDDVWDIKVWREIKVPLQDRHLGSRVVLTTRNEEVASNSFGVESYVYRIQPLQKNEAWELFSRKAFSTKQHKTCPTELKSLACQLVEKCEGLPLGIVALGGFMSSKKSLDQWQQVCNNLNWYLHNNSSLDPVRNILLLSFNDLPSQLKHCFLYCSLFPEDYLFKSKRLTRLWIAEGFVENMKGVTPEEVADGYLRELCFLSMLQVADDFVSVTSSGTSSGRPKKFKMHDLMREFSLSTAEKEKFGYVYNGREVMEEISTRRLSIHRMEGEIKSWRGMSKIRSLLVFDTDMSSLSFLNTLVSRFKLLRTLDLEDVQIDNLPGAVVYLFNLRYLNLKGTLIEELPESIRCLRNLQFLNIRDTKIESLPQGIMRLLNLRNLSMFRYTWNLYFNVVRGTKAPSNICKLQKLQSLSIIESEGDTCRLIANMTQLKSICISNVKERDEIDLWVSIKKFTLLQSLGLMASNEEEILPVKAQCPPLPHLRKLTLFGRLQNVTPWFSSLHSLTALFLHWSRLEEDLLPQIEALLNLTRLCLCNAYVGDELCFHRGFVKLMRLELLNFASVKKITIENGVMPNLRYLCVDSFMELKTVPLGLEYLSTLQYLGLKDVPIEVIRPIQKGGVDRSKVQHIPEIIHVFEQSSNWIHENLA